MPVAIPLIGAATSIVGGIINHKAASDASKTQATAATAAGAPFAPIAAGMAPAYQKQLDMYGIQLPANSAPMQPAPVNPVAAAGGGGGPYGMSSTPPQQGAVQMPQGYSLGSLIPSPTAQTIQNGPGGSSYRPGRI
jgi:hypothetical protein